MEVISSSVILTPLFQSVRGLVCEIVRTRLAQQIRETSFEQSKGDLTVVDSIPRVATLSNRKAGIYSKIKGDRLSTNRRNRRLIPFLNSLGDPYQHHFFSNNNAAMGSY